MSDSTQRMNDILDSTIEIVVTPRHKPDLVLAIILDQHLQAIQDELKEIKEAFKSIEKMAKEGTGQEG